MLSAIMASTKVRNWARKPGWRIAEKDRFVECEALTAMDSVSLIGKPSISRAMCGRIRQRNARDQFLGGDVLLDMKMAPVRGPFPCYIFLSIMGFIAWW